MIIKPYKILNEEWKSLRDRTKERSSELGSLDKVILRVARPFAPIIHNLPRKLAIAYMAIVLPFAGALIVQDVRYNLHKKRAQDLAQRIEFYDGKEGVSEKDSRFYSEAYERIPDNAKRWLNDRVDIGDGDIARTRAEGFLSYDEVDHLLDTYKEDQKK